MGKPALTFNSRLFVFDEDFALNLSEDIQGWTISDSPNITGQPADSKTFVDQTMQAYSETLSPGRMYYGTKSKVLADRSEAYVMAIVQSGNRRYCRGGRTGWVGVPTTVPNEDSIESGITFLRTAPWMRGMVAVPFFFMSGALSVDVGSFSKTDVAYLIVTEKTGTPATAAITLATTGAGSASKITSFSRPSGKPVDLSGFGTANSNAKLTITDPCYCCDYASYYGGRFR